MTKFVVRRLIILVPLLLVISLLSFIVMQLPPGNYVETYVKTLELRGSPLDANQIDALYRRYGLDMPIYMQYLVWIKNFIRGDMGYSYTYNRPVADIIWERVPKTVAISSCALLLTWILAIPIGILSAIKQYSAFDYIFTAVGFIGLALPGFLFALVLMYVVFSKTGWAVQGLFSPTYETAPWSLAKLVDMLKNVWLPILVLATSGTAGLIRILRGTLLDEIKKQYVITARAKGMKEVKLIIKYPVRVAINPVVSTVGWLLPAIIGGEVIVSKVLNMKTIGPVLYDAIQNKDMYLAGGVIMLLSFLTIIGTLVSDILLAWLDPRIRYD
jgi:peptide/nickel transport system permease protein